MGLYRFPEFRPVEPERFLPLPVEDDGRRVRVELLVRFDFPWPWRDELEEPRRDPWEEGGRDVNTVNGCDHGAP